MSPRDPASRPAIRTSVRLLLPLFVQLIEKSKSLGRKLESMGDTTLEKLA
jgi:hypothetical protein